MNLSESTDYSAKPSSVMQRIRAKLHRNSARAVRFIQTPFFSIPCIVGFCSLGCVGLVALISIVGTFLLYSPNLTSEVDALPNSFPSQIKIAHLDQAHSITIRDMEQGIAENIMHGVGAWFSAAGRQYAHAKYKLKPHDDLTTVTIDWWDLSEDRLAVLAHYGVLFKDLGYELATYHDADRSVDEGFVAQDDIKIHIFIFNPVDNQVIDFMRVVVQYPITKL